MTRCITRVSTWCSTNSGVRVSAKQAANRSVSRIARSVWPSSRAPASEVIAPPSKLATTARPATGGNSNNAGLQSVGIGASYGFEKICDRNTILSESAPQCTRFGEKSGLGLLERRDGAVILEDFPDDPPNWSGTAGWQAPALPALDTPETPAGWEAALMHE